MRFLLLTSALAAFASAQSSTTMDASSTATDSSAAPSTVVDSSPAYSITALPAVISQPACIFNCMIPIGLADPSGCDDVTNDCACLSAPADVEDFLTECVNTVCPSTSTSAFGVIATSLYQSYCSSAVGSASFAAAFSSEAAAAASSTAAESSASSSAASAASKASTAATASATAKSDSAVWTPSIFTASVSLLTGVLVLFAM